MNDFLLFDRVSDFSEGVAMVCLNHHIGYLDRRGDLVIRVSDTNVDLAAAYGQSLALARVGNYYGYLNRRGGWAIDVQFRQAKTF